MARDNILRLRADINAEKDRVPPLVVQITRQLRHDIFDGIYPPGQPIREQEIADRLGVSRAPVREAFRRLETDGLVQMLPWRGVRVVSLTREEISDIFEIAAGLMGIAGKLAATRATSEHLKQLAEYLRRMRVHGMAGLQRQALAEGFRAADLLGRASGSARLSQMLGKISALAYWEHQPILNAGMAYRRRALSYWHALLRALRAKNVTAAEQAARNITLNAKRLVLQQMQPNEGVEHEATKSSETKKRRTKLDKRVVG
jgi:DNA-binding GntR family transcriptional regulator